MTYVRSNLGNYSYDGLGYYWGFGKAAGGPKTARAPEDRPFKRGKRQLPLKEWERPKLKPKKAEPEIIEPTPEPTPTILPPPTPTPTPTPATPEIVVPAPPAGAVAIPTTTATVATPLEPTPAGIVGIPIYAASPWGQPRMISPMPGVPMMQPGFTSPTIVATSPPKRWYTESGNIAKMAAAAAAAMLLM